MPGAPVPLDIVAAQVKEARIETVFRYAHVYPRALALLGSGRIDVKPLITDTFAFEDSIAAFEYAARPRPESVKVQIAPAPGWATATSSSRASIGPVVTSYRTQQPPLTGGMKATSSPCDTVASQSLNSWLIAPRTESRSGSRAECLRLNDS